MVSNCRDFYRLMNYQESEMVQELNISIYVNEENPENQWKNDFQ